MTQRPEGMKAFMISQPTSCPAPGSSHRYRRHGMGHSLPSKGLQWGSFSRKGADSTEDEGSDGGQFEEGHQQDCHTLLTARVGEKQMPGSPLFVVRGHAEVPGLHPFTRHQLLQKLAADGSQLPMGA